MIDKKNKNMVSYTHLDERMGIRMPRTEALIRAQAKYQQSKLKQVKFWIQKESEQDIIEKLNSVPNTGQYIKDLIRKDIERGGK